MSFTADSVEPVLRALLADRSPFDATFTERLVAPLIEEADLLEALVALRVEAFDAEEAKILDRKTKSLERGAAAIAKIPSPEGRAAAEARTAASTEAWKQDRAEKYAEAVVAARADLEAWVPVAMQQVRDDCLRYTGADHVAGVAKRLVDWVAFEPEAGQKDFPFQLPVLEPFAHLLAPDRIDPVFLCGAKVRELASAWSDLDDAGRHERLLGLLVELGERGILTLLGMQCTVGSSDVIMPSFGDLVIAFNQGYVGTKDGDPETVSCGARALAKHFHRGQERWFGVLAGNDLQLNQGANELLMRVLTESVWFNTHKLPQEVITFEARNIDGYGIRWTATGEVQFRGLLDPYTADGHDNKWKH